MARRADVVHLTMRNVTLVHRRPDVKWPLSVEFLTQVLTFLRPEVQLVSLSKALSENVAKQAVTQFPVARATFPYLHATASSPDEVHEDQAYLWGSLSRFEEALSHVDADPASKDQPESGSSRRYRRGEQDRRSDASGTESSTPVIKARQVLSDPNRLKDLFKRQKR